MPRTLIEGYWDDNGSWIDPHWIEEDGQPSLTPTQLRRATDWMLESALVDYQPATADPSVLSSVLGSVACVKGEDEFPACCASAIERAVIHGLRITELPATLAVVQTLSQIVIDRLAEHIRQDREQEREW